MTAPVAPPPGLFGRLRAGVAGPVVLAVAVTDSRLVATTPIRAAGDTIVVNFRPLTPPYRVSAIGADRVRFEASDIARRFDRWTELFGLGFSVAERRVVTVPGYTGRVSISAATPAGVR